jgi:hypothetical protein
LERLQAASAAFTSAHESFSNSILGFTKGHEGEQSGKATITKEDFEVYAATVAELIAAAKDLDESSPYLPNSTRVKFQRAIEALESAWAAFGTVSEGRVNGPGLMPFLDALTAFLTARQEFCEAGAAAMERKAKKLGAGGR